ncbi:MAG: type IV secretion system protein [Rickettsiales bacterium]
MILISISFFEISNSAFAVNVSVFNDVRNVTGKDCLVAEFDEEEFDTEEIDGEITANRTPDPCYESNYDENKQICEVGGFGATMEIFNNLDLTWNYGNQTCLAYVLTAGITMQSIFMAARYVCPMPDIFAKRSAELADDVKNGAAAAASATGATVSKEAAKQTSNVQKLGTKGTQSIGEKLNGAAKTPFQSFVTRGKNLIKRTSGPSSPWQTASMVIDPFMIIEMGIFAGQCAYLPNCCAAFGTTTAAYVTAVATLAGLYYNARTAYLNTEVCGEGYKIWKKGTDVDEKNKLGVWQKELGFYAKCLDNYFKDANHELRFSEVEATPKDHTAYNRLMKFKAHASQFGLNTDSQDSTNDCMVNSGSENLRNEQQNLSNVYYREYLYKGIEYTDSGPGECKNPSGWDSNFKKKTFGYSEENQKYYFRGSAEAPNYQCERFLIKGSQDKTGMEAFECCKKRSMGAICLERRITGKYKFCSMDDGECSINLGNLENPQAAPTKYDISEAESDPRFICAKSYNHCPFDHNLAGGTDYAQQYPKRPSIITNFCQYLRHCVKRVPYSRVIPTDPDGFFVASACNNLMGDSQFFYDEINLKYSPVRSRNFSAPIVQCIKESIENNFLQIAGDTKCTSSEFVYDPIKKKCVSVVDQNLYSTDYAYVKGDVRGITLFQKMQNQFKNIIKIVLVLSVVMFGYQIMFAVPEMHINKKTISVFLVKIGLVSFFALGNAWQGLFINQILNVSTELSNITFLPNAKKKDGCQFPKKNYQYVDKLRALELNDLEKYDILPPQYPPGKNYLRIWDTLDCKLVRAIGYGPNVDAANIAKMIFAGFITGGVGIVFFLASFALAFMLLSVIFRAIQITVMSLLAVILLVYISPITITCSLFERTKGIFENWYKQLLGYIFQPMILFAYLGLFITVIDSVFIGDASFKTSSGGKNFELPKPDCSGVENTSLFCIFNFPKFKNYTGLEFFDLAIPILVGLNPEKINTILKGAIIMFVMYSFMDKITFVAKKLVGGQELSADKAPNIAGVAKKAIRAVQKRALNATKRLAIQGGGLAAKGGRFALSKGKRGDITPDGDKKQDGDSSSAGNDAKGNDSKDDDSKGDDSKSGGDAPNGVGK